MTVIEYARKVGVHPVSVYGKIKRGTIKYLLKDGNYEISEKEQWVDHKPGVKASNDSIRKK